MAPFSSLHLSNSSSPSSTTINNTKICSLLEETNNDDNNYNNATIDSSSIVTNHKHEITHKINANKRKSKEPSFANCAQSKDKREVRGKKLKKMKYGEEKNKEEEEAPKGYIHVRARRGQATDSHSLAERVRREKISGKMKLLQALVPGCDKVTGKALMLDEIINYVQSLQNQVEFLSMKLASVNPMFYDLGSDFESFIVMPDENLSNLPQEYSPNSANSFLFQQEQIPNEFFQENRQVLWEVDEQRQRTTNQSGFNNDMFLFN